MVTGRSGAFASCVFKEEGEEQQLNTAALYPVISTPRVVDALAHPFPYPV